jgi:hypothetical protein
VAGTQEASACPWIKKKGLGAETSFGNDIKVEQGAHMNKGNIKNRFYQLKEKKLLLGLREGERDRERI